LIFKILLRLEAELSLSDAGISITDPISRAPGCSSSAVPNALQNLTLARYGRRNLNPAGAEKYPRLGSSPGCAAL
jgi:hypothetical protein